MNPKRSKPSWAANLKIGRSSGRDEPLYDLDEFTDASLQEWDAYGRAVRDYHYALFFDLDGQRAARHKELRSAIQRVAGICVPLDGWCRLVNFKYSTEALSPAGSLKWVGQRFNFGIDIDPARFSPFPALYVAENFETAFREYHGLPRSVDSAGLQPEELSLEDRGNWTTLQVTGHINNVLDLTKITHLKGICQILAKFNLSDRVRHMEKKARRSATALVRTPAQLLASLMTADWRSWPVHFDVPANSQVFGQMVQEAGFEGIVYRSSKGADRCLAIFTRHLGNSDSSVAVKGECPTGTRFLEINAANCLDI